MKMFILLTILIVQTALLTIIGHGLYQNRLWIVHEDTTSKRIRHVERQLKELRMNLNTIGTFMISNE